MGENRDFLLNKGFNLARFGQFGQTIFLWPGGFQFGQVLQNLATDLAIWQHWALSPFHFLRFASSSKIPEAAVWYSKADGDIFFIGAAAEPDDEDQPQRPRVLLPRSNTESTTTTLGAVAADKIPAVLCIPFFRWHRRHQLRGNVC